MYEKGPTRIPFAEKASRPRSRVAPEVSATASAGVDGDSLTSAAGGGSILQLATARSQQG